MAILSLVACGGPAGLAVAIATGLPRLSQSARPLLLLVVLLESLAENVAERCARSGRTKLRNGLLLFGDLVRLDALTIVETTTQALVPFLKDSDADWDGDIVQGKRPFVTAVGAGTTYPDYKPAPFIVAQEVEGVDMVTVVTEGIFSYCGVKVKIDTDRHIGHERDVVRVDGEPIGHVMTSEYGSKMLSLGGVEHLTGGSKKEGRVTCDVLLRLCNSLISLTSNRIILLGWLCRGSCCPLYLLGFFYNLLRITA